LGVLNGESMFVDRRRLLDVIGDELRRSKVRTDPFSLQGTGDKRYLETEGWEGSFLRNRVVLLLTHALEGWEWSGVAVTEFPEATWGEILGPPERGSNQPLSLTIKSPWPRGLTLRAGGIIPFTIQLVRCAGAGPYPLPLLCIFRLAASSPCGLGPGGLYYGGVAGFNFTHGGDDFFAIDFARYRFGVPLQNQTFGTQVLAVQMGMVSGVNAAIATGATSTDNRVLVKHLTEADFIMIVILEILSGRPLRPFATPRFTSMYLHLDGPFKIPVSPGMFVRQGANLGAMDDTGRSLHHHLHFSIHDRAVTGTQAEGALTPAGRSVRPNPMDGQRLLDFDDGACVFSTNI
jgi:hypothetical protein